MGIRIALAGNPNSGKTTLFNALTGANQYVGNWPGVTVEKKEGKLRKREDVTLTDLPGIYSLSPYTLEEVVARNYLVNERPDAILNIVDGTNLERNLYLTTQLTELGIPVVIAINMMDVVRKNGDAINLDELSRELGCRIVSISALKGTGIKEAAAAAIEAAERGEPAPVHRFSGSVEHALAHIEEATVHDLPERQQRWYSVKLFERDERVLSHLSLDEEVKAHIEQDIAAVEAEEDDDAESIITNERYVYIAGLMRTCYRKKREGGLTVSDRIDRVVTNRFLALPIFALIIGLVYWIAMNPFGSHFTSAGDTTVGLMETLFGDIIQPALEKWLTNIGMYEWLISLIVDGIVGGVGAALSFVPQMLILFLLLAILEDCGYMARIAFIMDRVFRKFGLSGKSFIPMLVATGCAVPGIMASRTIEQDRDRKMTIMTTGFIPCSAKLPVIGFIAGALFGRSPWIAVLAYFIGVAAVIVSGIILKKTKPFAGDPAPFVMELPAYHLPVPGNIFRAMWERGWSFIKRAGTIIVAASILVWTLNSLSFLGGFHYITDPAKDTSILEVVGTGLAWIFKPLGFGRWQAAVASVLGLVAKEEIVGTFGTFSSMASPEMKDALVDIVESGGMDISILGQEFFGGVRLAGLSFLIFNLLCAPCFAAMGSIRREMNNWKWTAGAIGYMCAFAYSTSFMVYQFGSWFTKTGGNVVGTILASLVAAFLLYLLFRPNPYRNEENRMEVRVGGKRSRRAGGQKAE